MITNVIKVAVPFIVAFASGIIITPALTHWLYKKKMWKKYAGKKTFDGKDAEVFNKLHEQKEVGTPRMGGIIIWASAFITISIIWIISRLFPTDITTKLEFLSRDQTWIPLGTLLLGGAIGLIDDYFEVKGKGGYKAGGLSLKKRLLIVGAMAIFISSWFYFKVGIDQISILGNGALHIGWLIIPLFLLITWGIYAGGIIDGIDGLAGGIFAIIFSAYGVIAFAQHQINLAAFCIMLVGSILAFLWFNIPPARFYMSETGSMALTVTLAVVAFMTDSPVGGIGVTVLPLIALPLVITVLSVIIQLLSKKFRHGKKVFRSTPIHHHLEAIGWSREKITMRYWIVCTVTAAAGVVIPLIGGQ